MTNAMARSYAATTWLVKGTALEEEPDAAIIHCNSLGKDFGYCALGGSVAARLDHEPGLADRSIRRFASSTDEISVRMIPRTPRIRGILALLAMTAALNHPDEFRLYMKGALANDCTAEEIHDLPLRVAIYCGIPAANEAHRIANDVLNAHGRNL
jgi:hypothetical protein